jgi:hypothetical protein
MVYGSQDISFEVIPIDNIGFAVSAVLLFGVSFLGLKKSSLRGTK